MIKDLVKYWIRENLNERLVDIPPNFYNKIREYLLRLTMTELKDSDIAKSMKYKEKEFIKKMVIDLLLIRLSKIFFLIRKEEKIDLNKLPIEEQNFFIIIKNEINNFFQIKKDISEREKAREPISNKENMVLIKFLKPFSKIRISKEKILGPFAKNDIAFLPEEMIEKLLKKNIVKIIYKEED